LASEPGDIGGGQKAGFQERDKPLLSLLSRDLGRSAAPYAEMARKLGWTEEEVLKRVDELRAQGVIRRLGAVLVHQRAGFPANAMVVWQVEPERLDEAGRALGALEGVSHCYWRAEAPGWPYNLYTMVHARSQGELQAAVESMAALARAADWRTLGSLQELKKTSPEFFPESLPPEGPPPEGGDGF
jgi:DNA-binding Lrp family transcriptional regulator